ncbi:MAG: acyl--CoA ligase [Fusobacteriaceae bacterium]|jgi:fatty-acyl-CoA synthase|nr:acyl--CoA ligase [Fusobacteriaceae bacterium]
MPELQAITILDQFFEALENTGERISITDSTGEYSWREINDLSDMMAYQICLRGVNPRDAAAIIGRNSVYWVVTYLAILKAGAVPVLINPTYTEEELEKTRNIIDYVHSFKTKQDDFAKLVNQLRIMGTLTKEEHTLVENRIKNIRPTDLASFLFTSGTASLPKAVPMTHFQMINVAREATEILRWNDSDRVCLPLSLFHCFGLSTGLFASFVHRGSLHFTDSYHSVDVMKTVEKYHCTVLNGVPTMYLAILKSDTRKSYDLSSLCSGIIAGSTVYESDFLAISRELPVPHLMQSYGQTEAAPSITFSDYDDPPEIKAKSVGKPMKHLSLQICDYGGKKCKAHETGEIEIKGYHVMTGYYNDEKATQEAFTQEGWLRTGDMGYLDEKGNLYVTGRKKEIIIRSGENISPLEIEEALIGIDGIEQVKVFGIPSPVVQEDVVACINGAQIAEESIRKVLKSKLADYKIPKYILRFSEFPLKGNGKIDVQKLKIEAKEKIDQLCLRHNQ